MSCVLVFIKRHLKEFHDSILYRSFALETTQVSWHLVERVNKWLADQIMGYYTALGMNSLPEYARTNMDDTKIMFNYNNQKEKKHYFSMSRKYKNRKRYSMLLEVRIVVSLGGIVTGRGQEWTSGAGQALVLVLDSS